MPKTFKITQLVDEDIVNYKKCSMFIGTCRCSFKCCHEQGIPVTVCQNHSLGNAAAHEIRIEDLVRRFQSNKLTEAVVFGGLEPMDQLDELVAFITEFRKVESADIVIYTGYNEDEIADQVKQLAQFKDIYIKFGRFVFNGKPRFDEVLGVKLASDNQYGKKVS